MLFIFSFIYIFFISQQIPLHTYYGFQFTVFMGVWKNGCLCLYLFLVPFFGLLSFSLFVLSYSDVLIFISSYYIDIIIIP